MKFKIEANSIRQFGTVQVKISVKMLAKILQYISDSNVSDWAYSNWVHSIERAMKDGGEFFMFRSGAKLCYSTYTSEFYIYGYHYSGKDILAAIEQLKMGHALYKAAYYGDRMFDQMGQGRDHPTLKVDWDYSRMKRVA